MKVIYRKELSARLHEQVAGNEMREYIKNDWARVNENGDCLVGICLENSPF